LLFLADPIALAPEVLLRFFCFCWSVTGVDGVAAGVTFIVEVAVGERTAGVAVAVVAITALVRTYVVVVVVDRI
jgi:hypothetical protein